jgi:hypothetical protein
LADSHHCFYLGGCNKLWYEGYFRYLLFIIQCKFLHFTSKQMILLVVRWRPVDFCIQVYETSTFDGNPVAHIQRKHPPKYV